MPRKSTLVNPSSHVQFSQVRDKFSVPQKPQPEPVVFSTSPSLHSPGFAHSPQFPQLQEPEQVLTWVPQKPQP